MARLTLPIKMERFLIETPHDERNCQSILDQVYAMGFLYHFDWGCPEGVHVGWAIIEAEDEAQARLAVPSIIRRQARIVKVNKYSGDTQQFLAIHGSGA